MTRPDNVEILHVEDDPHDAALTLRAFGKISLANRLHWAKDGVEALDFLFGTGQYERRGAATDVKLVLLDIKLPKIDGIEVLMRIRGDERTRALPVVILTSSADERDLVESYDLGVNSYIVKPVDAAAFVQTVSQAGLYWMVTNQPPD